ncbi:MAG TPA: ATP-binding protein [Candidatus Sulfotelmatobacter sp.]|nr:ATP-binding protein [Candidatus Sulfotelmatobacter sp.]
MDNFCLQLEVHSNPTRLNQEIRSLQNCISDLIRVQLALQELGQLREHGPTSTEPRRAEAALQKLQSELAHVARLTTMGELAASIAHEINQPLGAIVNNGNLCLRLLGDTSAARESVEMREALADIVQDANRANAIVARVRAMTRRTPSEKALQQLPAVIAAVILLARHELDNHSIDVRTKMAADLPGVLGDRVQLQQVFLNLVINSIEAMAGVAEAQRILTISGERGKLDGEPAALITVHDSGAGFPPDAEHKIFEAFYTTKPHGLGMGLRISRSIVEAHGGRLWAKSARGKGTTFSCLLPAAEIREPKARDPEPETKTKEL